MVVSVRHIVLGAVFLSVVSHSTAQASDSVLTEGEGAAAGSAAQEPLVAAPLLETDAPRAPDPALAKIRPKARTTSYRTARDARLAQIRPKSRPYEFALPHTRWEHRPGHKDWTAAAMKAVLSHGAPLTQTVPDDYRDWCPAYKENDALRRAMFWVGFMSALAKHESTYRADAVGGGGLWYGLLQILPSTARLYNCQAKTGEALKDGGLNLSCATRIMSKTVARDQIIHGFFPETSRKYQGVTQDWGPMHSSAKREEMAAWTRRQAYCVSRKSLRPKARPDGVLAQKDG